MLFCVVLYNSLLIGFFLKFLDLVCVVLDLFFRLVKCIIFLGLCNNL